MSIDRRLREGFRQAADALTPDSLAALHAVERRARRHQRRAVVNQLAAAALAMALVLVGLPWAVGQWQRPDTAAPPAPAPDLAGEYVVDIGESGLARSEGMVGRWIIRLTSDGAIVFVPPDSFQGSRTGMSYQVDGDQIRTNAFVNDLCGAASSADPVGTYRWSRTASMLRFAVATDSCEARRLLFADQPWEEVP
jgi:hypothetical protein